jgi:hypothetical protein
MSGGWPSAPPYVHVSDVIAISKWCSCGADLDLMSLCSIVLGFFSTYTTSLAVEVHDVVVVPNQFLLNFFLPLLVFFFMSLEWYWVLWRCSGGGLF